MSLEGNVSESRVYQQHLLVPGTRKRKCFGLLERPSVPPSVPIENYKLCILGKAGVGKTWCLNRLAGREPFHQYVETVGIDVCYVYWPMKCGNRVKLFRLELWDAGDASVKRYNHVLPACQEGCDGVLICWAISDRDSWLELPQTIEEAAKHTDRAAVFAVGTKWDNLVAAAVEESEMLALEREHKVHIIRMGPHDASSGDEMSSIAPTLNIICTKLWQRDQKLLSIKHP